MIIQYNVPIKVLDPEKGYLIQNSLAKYPIFTDGSGNLDGTCFSCENLPYIGEVVVVKTIKEKAAKTAHEVLKGIEGLVVLPITQSTLEEDKQLVDRARENSFG